MNLFSNLEDSKSESRFEKRFKNWIPIHFLNRQDSKKDSKIESRINFWIFWIRDSKFKRRFKIHWEIHKMRDSKKIWIWGFKIFQKVWFWTWIPIHESWICPALFPNPKSKLLLISNHWRSPAKLSFARLVKRSSDPIQIHRSNPIY